jgi:hypothetical protein
MWARSRRLGWLDAQCRREAARSHVFAYDAREDAAQHASVAKRGHPGGGADEGETIDLVDLAIDLVDLAIDLGDLL